MRRALALILLCLSLGTAAQSYPAKPVRIVVPFPAGGTADLLARTLGDQLAAYWGQPVVIENRPGAGSMLATQYVQRAPADGYTLLVIAPSFVVNPMLQPDAKYDALKDFAPVTLAVTSPLVLAVNPTLAARSLAELGDLSRASPGKFSYGTVGPATTQQMLGEILKGDSKIDWVYVPYPGGAPSVTALLGNHITAVIANYSELSQQLAAGKLRALAVGSAERLDALPDVPTIAELGFDPAMGTIWFGFVAPAGTPRVAIERLQNDIGRALKVPAVREKLVAQSLYPAQVPPEQFGGFLATQVQKYSKIIKDAGIKAN
ncbi:MAG: Bug family tripartite tricarboxylate transporter substrate binding protein [Usitatibacter sp.]